MNDSSTNDHLPRPIDQGRAARKAGILRADNPYEPGSLKAKFWANGWDTPDWSGIVVDGSDSAHGECFNVDRAFRSHLRNEPQPISTEVDVISSWDALQWIAFGRPRISYSPVPLSRLLDEDAECTLSAVEEASINVAAAALRRYCAAGNVRCGFIEDDFSDDDCDFRAFIFCKEEFRYLEFLWDGSIYSKGMFHSPEVFILYEDLKNIMSPCEGAEEEQFNNVAKIRGFDSPRRGPKSIFNETEFWSFVACMADLDGIPDTQSEFIRCIDEVLIQNWGSSPGETWLKKRAMALYRARSQFRKGNSD
ncbi:hypothetical protein [Magnetospirillum molischianum]|uniref:Uncharacterized protein n=1 Tax=Magnetospirillum molischianum DSM 120 TaxID=1150626 RepID=H8FTV4_MAGML|nr:hypothetical protein [Magnetospirillum molischianum]CCG41811.1 hypothetical protein PHAMO_290099 [Magnetospirillum molischianum DSM 120]